jgi:hypothetical protein
MIRTAFRSLSAHMPAITVGASYPTETAWTPVPTAHLSMDPAALEAYRILPVRLDRSTPGANTPTPPREALMIELQYRHGTIKRQLLMKHRFRGAASLEKKGRHAVALNYLISDDPTQREVTEHIYFPEAIDAMDFHMRFTEFL